MNAIPAFEESPFRGMERSELTRQRLRLATVSDIRDMQQFATEWRQLAEAFAAVEAPASAELCSANAAYYGSLIPGAYAVEERTGYQALVPEPAVA